MADTKGKATPDAGAKNMQPQGVNCLVAKGTRIEGQFSSAENTRIDGELQGELKCDKKLVAGETSVIEGKIWAAEAVFMGKITGQVMVTGSVQLTATAVLTGTLKAKVLMVEEGAQLNGDLKIEG